MTGSWKDADVRSSHAERAGGGRMEEIAAALLEIEIEAD
jgi:hypothetical protein